MNQSNKFFYIIILTSIASLAGLMFGLDLGIIGGAQDFIYHTFSIAPAQVFERACTVASVPFGALIGAIASAKLSLRYGRKNSLLITSVIYSVGILLIISLPSISFVIVGRFMMGFAVGLSCMVGPMYLSEVAPYEIRGAVVLIFQLAITLGILLAYVINYIFAGTGNWHGMFASCLIPAILLLIGVCFLPRSPRWLMQQGREKEAESVLIKLRGTSNITHETEEIKSTINHPKLKFTALFSRQLFPLVLLSFGLFVFQQLSGVNTIFYYVTTVFHQAGGSVKSELMASMLTASVNVIATVVGVWLIDKVGRRKLILTGMSMVVMALIVIALGFKGTFGSLSGMIDIIAILVFIAFYAVSLGGIPYVIMSEIFPLNARHWGMSIASFANWIFNTVIAFSFLYFVQKIGLTNTYTFYAVITLIGLCLMYFYLPETKNISIEEIEKHLFEGRKLRCLGK